jgi:hypothetical protein
MVTVVIVSIEPAKCLGFGSGSIRIQEIDHSGGIVKALFILDETAYSSFEERSTTWITVLTPRNTTYSYIIGRADPDWQLVGTNNITIWHWMLQETHDLECSAFYPSLVFPFEQFTMIFYVSSNMTRQFSVVCEIPHFSATVAQRDVHYNETILTYQPEASERPYLKEVIINVFHDSDYKVIALILYSLMIIIFALGFLLFKRVRDKVLDFRDYLMVSSSILIFLPVFFFTIRSSLAPNYLTVPDWLCLLSMSVYGTFLTVQVLCTKNPESEGVPGREQEPSNLPDYEPTTP